MKTFTDTAGRTWTLTLNLGTAITVREKLEIDLLSPEAGDPPLLTRLGTEEILLGQVLCAMLEKQFEAHNVTAEDIYQSFDGQTLLAAQNAFYQEMVDFFQSRGRTDRAKAVAAQMKLIDSTVKALESKIDELEIDKMVAGAMSGGLPEAWASIPGR